MKMSKCPNCGCELEDDPEYADENGEGAPMETADGGYDPSTGEGPHGGEGAPPAADDIAKAVVAEMRKNSERGRKG